MVLSLSTSNCSTTADMGGDGISTRMTAGEATGTDPELARRRITIPLSSSRSSNRRAANSAGSSAGTLREAAVFASSQLTKPSSTDRALSGPDWIR